MAQLRIINNFDTSFALETEAQKVLFGLLESDGFLGQVAGQIEAQKVEFTGILFQPVPHGPGTPRGISPEFAEYFTSREYAIINIPPNFMFKARISNPSRLCAIFRRLK
ncbi:hypothetical protein [Synechococcus sp. PCC 7336]|uniref:hypothetical protein n=1 Tax=Synechococcus sp. PCC 7336 TaxID=195250 RepID=UPI00034CE7B5|nr:hypothetical protein [Synechococcus sp. PCC 7336]